MTNEFHYLMYLLKVGAAGETAVEPERHIDWQSIMRLAREQSILPLISYAMKRSPNLSCPDEMRTIAATTLRGAAINNCMRQTAIIRLLGEMELQGIHAVLMKGYAIAGLYSAPECRISADADVWVDPKDEERACGFLEDKGFAVEPRWKNGHHAVCHHPRMGCLELHVILYDEIVEDVWFGKMDGREFIVEPHLKIETQDGSYYTLGYTDHLVFLALHMIKHFIISGMSLRMMMDIALYIKAYKNELDMSRFWETLDRLKYSELMNCILWSVIDYCGFSVEDFPGIMDNKPDTMSSVLDDLEAGGWMGCNDKDAREDGWREYNRQLLLKDKKPWQYKLYMIKWQWSSYVKAVFPTKKQLAVRYPYVNAKPWLIPYAWVHRLIVRGSKYIARGNVTRQIVSDESLLKQSGKERVALFKQLEMM